MLDDHHRDPSPYPQFRPTPQPPAPQQARAAADSLERAQHGMLRDQVADVCREVQLLELLVQDHPGPLPPHVRAAMVHLANRLYQAARPNPEAAP